MLIIKVIILPHLNRHRPPLDVICAWIVDTDPESSLFVFFLLNSFLKYLDYCEVLWWGWRAYGVGCKYGYRNRL